MYGPCGSVPVHWWLKKAGTVAANGVASATFSARARNDARFSTLTTIVVSPGVNSTTFPSGISTPT